MEEVESELHPRTSGKGALKEFWHELVVLATTPVYVLTVLGATVYTGDNPFPCDPPIPEINYQAGISCCKSTLVPPPPTGSGEEGKVIMQ